MSDNFWLDAVPDLSDFYNPSHISIFGDDPRADVNAFVDKFTKRWGEKPSTSYVGMGYSLIDAWARAVDRAKSSTATRFSRNTTSSRTNRSCWELLLYARVPPSARSAPRADAGADGKHRAIEMRRNEWVPPPALLLRVGEYAN